MNIIGEYYDEMNYRGQSITFQFGKDPFSRGAPGENFIHQEALFLMSIFTNKASG